MNGKNNFGFSVSIYDGSYAIVGSYLYKNSAGAAFIYSKSIFTSKWSLVQTLQPNDATSSDFFGLSVCICNDYAIVGTASDAAYIFKREYLSWRQTQKLMSQYLRSGDGFGRSVSLNCDSKNYYAIIGVTSDPTVEKGAGGACLFELVTLSSGEERWQEIAHLTASHGRSGDHLGNSVAASNNDVIIGAVAKDDKKKSKGGAAYIVSGIKTSTSNYFWSKGNLIWFAFLIVCCFLSFVSIYFILKKMKPNMLSLGKAL